MIKLLPLITCWLVVKADYYDTFTGLKISKQRYDQLESVGRVPICAARVAPCQEHERRREDGSCTNPAYPQRGTQFTPFRRLLDPAFSANGGLRLAENGAPLPLARPLRVALMSDGRIFSKRRSLLQAMYLLFTVGDVTSVHDTVNYVTATLTCCKPGGEQDPRCIPIKVLDDDLHLRATNVRCLNLTRSITYQRLNCAPQHVPPERINQATPILDLSIVYGNSIQDSQLLRSYEGGRLRSDVISGKEWPPTGGVVCVNNVPPLETRCHISAGANTLLSINLLYLLFFRQHNQLSTTLQQHNPCWNDARLYSVAREINMAYFLHVLYYELMPELLGEEILLQNLLISKDRGHSDQFDPKLEPRVSIEFVTSLRWAHSIQEGRLLLYTKDGKIYNEIANVDLTLRTGALLVNNTIEGVTRGTFRQAGADIDDVIDPDLGERALARLQLAADVVSSDIMKGRDLGLAQYTQYRQLCHLPVATTFEHLKGWMDAAHVETLSRHYQSPADIDLMSGLLLERGAGHLPPTLACILMEQLARFKRSDRFWYERPTSFSTEQLIEIRKMTIGKLLCQHGDGVDAVQPRAFIIPGPGNEITDCSKYEMPDLSVFKDNSCYNTMHVPSLNIKDPTHDQDFFSHSDYSDYEEKYNMLPNKYGYSYEKPINCKNKCTANPFEMYSKFK